MMKNIEVNIYVFSALTGVVGFYLRSLVKRLDDVIKNQNNINENIVELIVKVKNSDKRHDITESDLKDFNKRLNGIDMRVTVLESKE